MKNNDLENADINDVFDDLLFCEEKLIEYGYQEGFSKGVSEGNPEGYHLGYHRGAEIGAELGYYLGVVESHLALNSKKEVYSDKILKHLEILKTEIDQFPNENKEDIDILGLIEKIRGLYKKTCALLKIDSNYPEADILSF